MSIASLITDVGCKGDNTGAIDVTLSGGTTPYNYMWSTSTGSGVVPTDQNQSGLTAGNYALQASDAHNCVKSAGFTVSEPAQALGLAEVTGSHLDVKCNGASEGKFEVAGTGGSGQYEYSYDGTNWYTSGVFSGLPAGSYDVTVRDRNSVSCVYTGLPTIVITEPTAIVPATRPSPMYPATAYQTVVCSFQQQEVPEH